ncbi:hypothetical protein MHB43_10290 [Paenibacillus sp. FSL H8-0317]|uniref:hypothetical protein n=1 Tax=Paenibacillus sp. FSL H8-0317 TaxID=2921385 RepID=UPI00324C701D
MIRRHYARNRKRLLELIDALELLDVHYVISTMVHDENSKVGMPRWIVDEVEQGKEVKIQDIPPGV